MNLFEGYVGVQIKEQLVNDIMFAILLFLFVGFGLVFRMYHQLFFKMVKKVFQVKQRASFFEITLGDNIGNEWIFRTFMSFQALFLSSVYIFSSGLRHGAISITRATDVFLYLGITFFSIVLFYFFKVGIYKTAGWIFVDDEHLDLWKANYNAVIGLWGVLLYIPVIWILFVDHYPGQSILLFVFLYFLCRFVIFYKTIRIFYIKRGSFLYLILYLCGQEIAPLFLLYKGIFCLYNFIEMSTLWR